MTKQPTVADVLHFAADKCLVAHYRYHEGRYKEKFSCCAIDEALHEMFGVYFSYESSQLSRCISEGLKNMGCRTGSHTLFRKYGDPTEYSEINHEVQGMRYMWLKWAALMAEEQGV
jgi:hypothetical protein